MAKAGLPYEINLLGYVAYLNWVGALGEVTEVYILLLTVDFDSHNLHADEVINVQCLAHCSCDAYSISAESDIDLLRFNVDELNTRRCLSR